MEFTGTLRFMDLGTGQWVLETDAGRQHPLVGAVPAGLRDATVVVVGRRVDAMGFGVSADRAIEVRRVRRA